MFAYVHVSLFCFLTFKVILCVCSFLDLGLATPRTPFFSPYSFIWINQHVTVASLAIIKINVIGMVLWEYVYCPPLVVLCWL